jgi:hypothetical protein
MKRCYRCNSTESLQKIVQSSRGLAKTEHWRTLLDRILQLTKTRPKNVPTVINLRGHSRTECRRFMRNEGNQSGSNGPPNDQRDQGGDQNNGQRPRINARRATTDKVRVRFESEHLFAATTESVDNPMSEPIKFAMLILLQNNIAEVNLKSFMCRLVLKCVNRITEKCLV